MITEQERMQHEAIKSALKQAILSNQNLNDYQKQMVINNVPHMVCFSEESRLF